MLKNEFFKAVETVRQVANREMKTFISIVIELPNKVG
jgi:hypothetical protein